MFSATALGASALSCSARFPIAPASPPKVKACPLTELSKSTLPPPSVSVLLCAALASASISVPSLTVVAPLYGLDAARVRVPLPFWMISPWLMAPPRSTEPPPVFRKAPSRLNPLDMDKLPAPDLVSELAAMAPPLKAMLPEALSTRISAARTPAEVTVMLPASMKETPTPVKKARSGPIGSPLSANARQLLLVVSHWSLAAPDQSRQSNDSTCRKTEVALEPKV